MKLALWYVAGSRETYAEQAEAVLTQKIAPFCSFSTVAVKAKSAGRDDAEFKRRAESEKLLEMLSSGDYLWLFDEKGKLARDSREYSQWLVQAFESGRRQIVMVIGGPYGFTDELRARAQKKVSLSPLTMNHHLAKLVALEQTYRALSIWKNLPYHN